MREGRPVAISALVWGEFLCGPVDDEASALARRIMRTQIPIGTDEATRGARLFNETGRRRGSFQDCLVAATAIEHGAALATSDHGDFEQFTVHGLAMEG